MESRDIRAELVAILRELARHARASELFDDPTLYLRLGRAALLACDLRRIEWVRADGALSRLHREEQARLLLEAVELRLAASEEARLFTAPVHGPQLGAWLERCAAEIERALASRLAVSGDLLACCLLEPAGWPRASELARAAIALGAAASGRLALARARYVAGRRAAAERGYRDVLARSASPRVLAQAREALGYACERRGSAREALVHLQHAAAHAAGMRAEVSSLGLALQSGDACVARWAAERLEERADAFPWAARFAREVRARWELAAAERDVECGAPEPRLLRELACDAPRPIPELCAELFPRKLLGAELFGKGFFGTEPPREA